MSFTIVRHSVSSTNLASIGYDGDTQTLAVEFHHGGIYHYYRVPRTIYDALSDAASKGSFLSSRIKNRYRFEQVG